jgi:hypothetical protein
MTLGMNLDDNYNISTDQYDPSSSSSSSFYRLTPVLSEVKAGGL